MQLYHKSEISFWIWNF